MLNLKLSWSMGSGSVLALIKQKKKKLFFIIAACILLLSREEKDIWNRFLCLMLY